MVEDSPVEVGMAVDVKQWESGLVGSRFRATVLDLRFPMRGPKGSKGVSCRHRRL